VRRNRELPRGGVSDGPGLFWFSGLLVWPIRVPSRRAKLSLRCNELNPQSWRSMLRQERPRPLLQSSCISAQAGKALVGCSLQGGRKIPKNESDFFSTSLHSHTRVHHSYNLSITFIIIRDQHLLVIDQNPTRAVSQLLETVVIRWSAQAFAKPDLHHLAALRRLQSVAHTQGSFSIVLTQLKPTHNLEILFPY